MKSRLERLTRSKATAQEPRALIRHIRTAAFPVVSRQRLGRTVMIMGSRDERAAPQVVRCIIFY
ncbi:hypothetical protein J6590_072580, partial [Homalodisca vitripennis]